jgi:hypothetical protein
MSPITPPDVRTDHRVGSAGEPSRRTIMVVLLASLIVLISSVIAAPWIAAAVSGSPRAGQAVPGAGPGAAGPGVGVVGPGMMGGPGSAGMMGGSGSTRMMSGSGMMSGRVWLAGDGVPVTSIAAARARAAAASAGVGLHPGEVIQFSANFYVELKDSSGAAVTEVLVNPATGAVSTEPGPAMMWNTGSRAVAVTSEQARSIGSAWLQADRPGESVMSLDAYPGYYTMDTVVAGRPVGMLSVNATTGAVWYHTWHGTFVAREDS